MTSAALPHSWTPASSLLRVHQHRRNHRLDRPRRSRLLAAPRIQDQGSDLLAGLLRHPCHSPVRPKRLHRVHHSQLRDSRVARRCVVRSGPHALPLPPPTFLRPDTLERPHLTRQWLQGRHLPMERLAL